MQKIYIIILFAVMCFVSLLVIVTKGQPVLVRKKIILGLLIMSLTAPSASVVSCKSGTSVFKDVWKSEGWVNEDTFRIISTGIPKTGINNPDERKDSAKKHAVLNAQQQITERFRDSRTEACSGVPEFTYSWDTVEPQLKAALKNGKTLAEHYDDEDNCEIVFEVKMKNLKTLIRGYGLIK